MWRKRCVARGTPFRTRVAPFYHPTENPDWPPLHTSEVKFADVAGLDQAKEELKEIKDFLADSSRYEAMGAKMPRGYLISGGPGLGKTLLAKALAGEAGVPFINVSGSEFIQMFVGVGAGRVRDLWKKAKLCAPCIIFIDEIDAIGKVRGRGVGASSDEQDQTLNQLLIEMDGMTSASAQIVVIAASNRVELLDPALTRAGRFDRHITLELPNHAARLNIIKVHAKGKPLENINLLNRLAEMTTGFSGAELASLLNEAAIVSVRNGQDVIDSKSLDQAFDRVILGLQRDVPLTQQEKIIIAYHEAGHAIVSEILAFLTRDPSFEVTKVTLKGRGTATGYTMLKGVDAVFLTRDQMLNQMTIALGGRVAEEMMAGAGFITTSSAQDIKKVERMARDMITQYGFRDDELSPVSVHEMTSAQGLNDHDRQVHRLATAAYRKAKSILESRFDLLQKVTKELLEHETLYGSDVKRIMELGGKKHQNML